MEDVWKVQSSGVEIEEFADIADYKRFLGRYGKEEETVPCPNPPLREVKKQ